MDLAHCNLEQRPSTADNNGNLEQRPSTADNYGNLVSPVQQFSAADSNGNLMPPAHKFSSAIHHGNLARRERQASTAIDASNVNHAGNPDVHPGTGGASSTTTQNISPVNFMHSSCFNYLPISSSSTTCRSNNTASIGIRPGQDAFAKLSSPSLGSGELSGNVFDPRMAKILVDESLGILQRHLCFDPNNVSVPVDANSSLDSQCAVVRCNIKRIDEHLRLIEPDLTKISEISEAWLRYVMVLPTQRRDSVMDGYEATFRSPTAQQVKARAGESVRILRDNILKEKRLLGCLESELRKAQQPYLSTSVPSGFTGTLPRGGTCLDNTTGHAVSLPQVAVVTVTTASTYSPPTASISRSWSRPPTTPFVIPPVTAPYVDQPPLPYTSVHRISQPKIRRPLLQVEPLKLDKFSGTIEEWPGFWKQFDVAVDSQEYSDIEKINLLYQCLEGEAKARVAGIPRSEENYDVVKNILRDAYDRPDRLLRILIGKLEVLPVANNGPSNLKTFHMELEAICRQLEAMGHNVNTLSTRVAIQKRLPLSLLQQWMEISGVDERMWTTNFLRDKLRQQVEIHESLGSYHQAVASNTHEQDTARIPFNTSDGVTCAVEESSARSEKSRSHTTVRKKFKCPFCGRDHRAARCDIYTTLQQRLRRAAGKGLCTKCLRGKHAANTCTKKFGPCRDCSRCHHTALCSRLDILATHHSAQAETQPYEDSKPIKRARHAVDMDYSDSDDFWKDNYLESEVEETDPPDEEHYTIEQDSVPSAVTAHNEPSTTMHKKAQETTGYLLAVASGRISKPNTSGRSERAYILLDSCSSTTYISKEMATKLKLKQAPSRKYNVSIFGSAKPKAMVAADANFDLHLTDGRHLHISAEVVPHIVGHTAMYDASEADLDNLQHLKSGHLPTKAVQPDILIGTKHLYKVGFVPTNQRLKSGFTVVKTDLGLVITGHGNIITNLQPVDSCNLTIQDLSKDKKRSKHRCPFCGRGHRPARCDTYTSLEQRIQRASAKGLCTRCLRGPHSPQNCTVRLGPCRICSHQHHAALCNLEGQYVKLPFAAAARGLSRSESHGYEVQSTTDLFVVVIDLPLNGSSISSTSAAAARDASSSEANVNEHGSDEAKKGPDLHDAQVQTELSASDSDLPVSQDPGPPSPDTDLQTQHTRAVCGTEAASVSSTQPIRRGQSVPVPGFITVRHMAPDQYSSLAVTASTSETHDVPRLLYGSGSSSTGMGLRQSTPRLKRKHRSCLVSNSSGSRGQCLSRAINISAPGFQSATPMSHGSGTSSSEVNAHRSVPPFSNASVSTSGIDMDLIRQAVWKVMDERGESTTVMGSNRSAPRTNDISVPATSSTAMGSNRSTPRTSDISVPTANVDMDLIRQVVREVMQERSGQAAAAPTVGGVRGHRLDDDGRRDDRRRSREHCQKRSSGGCGPNLSGRRHH